MTEDDIRNTAFSMPLHNPAYPRPPFRFVDREYFIISYETDIDALRAVVPEPLKVDNSATSGRLARCGLDRASRVACIANLRLFAVRSTRRSLCASRGRCHGENRTRRNLALRRRVFSCGESRAVLGGTPRE